ncbi:serine hydrolase [Streptomyces fagopyri]|uniref:serine hydrolase n=1 Tax=Streptomyces fagopyri TaxID=2662397 RepID=UPI0033D5FD0C
MPQTSGRGKAFSDTPSDLVGPPREVGTPTPDEASGPTAKGAGPPPRPSSVRPRPTVCGSAGQALCPADPSPDFSHLRPSGSLPVASPEGISGSAVSSPGRSCCSLAICANSPRKRGRSSPFLPTPLARRCRPHRGRPSVTPRLGVPLLDPALQGCDARRKSPAHRGRRVHRSPGTTYLHSDLNLISLRLVLEPTTDRSLEALLRDEITGHIGMGSIRYNPPTPQRPPGRTATGRSGRACRRLRDRDGGPGAVPRLIPEPQFIPDHKSLG